MNRVDVESKIEHYLDQIKKHQDKSDTSLKQACLIAGHVVGLYNGTTDAIAKRLGKSVSTIENWAHAAWLRAALLKDTEKRDRVHLLWRELSASKFWLAWDIHKEGFEALHYLEFVYSHKASGKDMMMEFKRDRDNGIAPLQVPRAKRTLKALAAGLLAQPKDLNNRELELCIMITAEEVF